MSTERWRFDWRILLIALLLATTANASSGAVENGSAQQLSRTEINALQGGASKYPYATLALLYLMRYPPSDQSGALYLEGVSSKSLSSLLLDSANPEAISNLFGSLQWSPYSWSAFFVQVSWSARTLASGARVFEFRTKLLSQLTAVDHPPLECPATVLLKAGGGVWFLERGSAM